MSRPRNSYSKDTSERNRRRTNREETIYDDRQEQLSELPGLPLVRREIGASTTRQVIS